MAATRPGTTYVTLDDALPLEAARADPSGFVAGLRGPVVIDEIQKAPDLLPAIKSSIDRDRRPGRFLLTGSANVLSLPKVAESLAGRMEVATLWPLSQGELSGRRETFLDRAMRGEPPARVAGDDDLLPRLARGGYPEASARGRSERRRAFFDAHLAALMARDVRDIAAIEDPGALRRLLKLAAVRSASLLNHSELARTLYLPVTTLAFAFYAAIFGAARLGWIWLTRRKASWDGTRRRSRPGQGCGMSRAENRPLPVTTTALLARSSPLSASHLATGSSQAHCSSRVR